MSLSLDLVEGVEASVFEELSEEREAVQVCGPVLGGDLFGVV